MKYFFYSLALLLSIWSLLSYTHLINNLLLPVPHQVFIYIYRGLITDQFFYTPLFQTLISTFLSFFLGSFIGILLGIIGGYHEKLYKILELPLDFFRSLPSLLLTPLSILFFGIGNLSSFFVISFSVFVYVFINSAYGIKYNKASFSEIGKLYKINKIKEFTLILLPSILPNIFAGFKMGFSIAFIVTIGSEMISRYQGLGGRIIDAYMIFNTKEVFSIIIIVGMLGYLGNKILDILEKKFIHWKGH